MENDHCYVFIIRNFKTVETVFKKLQELIISSCTIHIIFKVCLP